jgi:hypothetical protein
MKTYQPIVKNYQELTINEKINAKLRFWNNSTRGKAIVKNPLIAY